jgi:hypothetical protein
VSQELKKEFRSRVWEIQQRFINYVIALSVSCIAFAIYQSMNYPVLMWSLWPLGAAILCWGLTIFFGFQYILNGVVALKFNNIYLEAKSEDQRIRIVEETESVLEKSGYLFLASQYLFFGGIIFFVTWRVLEMWPK